MHELGLAQQTLDLALTEIQRAGAQRIRVFRLRIGEWSGVVPEALQFALETIIVGTPADGARIELEQVPAACSCQACGTVYGVGDYVYECPVCGTRNDRVCSGKEMDLYSLEVA